jgi:hypothetical protein
MTITHIVQATADKQLRNGLSLADEFITSTMFEKTPDADRGAVATVTA